MKTVNIVLLALLLSGCGLTGFRAPEVVILPEDRIYEVVPGTQVSVIHDKVEMDMTFVQPMFIVSQTSMIHYEEWVGERTRKKVKSSQATKRNAGIIGSILTILSSGFVVWRKIASKKKFTLSSE